MLSKPQDRQTVSILEDTIQFLLCYKLIQLPPELLHEEIVPMSMISVHREHFDFPTGSFRFTKVVIVVLKVIALDTIVQQVTHISFVTPLQANARSLKGIVLFRCLIGVVFELGRLSTHNHSHDTFPCCFILLVWKLFWNHITHRDISLKRPSHKLKQHVNASHVSQQSPFEALLRDWIGRQSLGRCISHFPETLLRCTYLEWPSCLTTHSDCPQGPSTYCAEPGWWVSGMSAVVWKHSQPGKKTPCQCLDTLPNLFLSWSSFRQERLCKLDCKTKIRAHPLQTSKAQNS